MTMKQMMAATLTVAALNLPLLALADGFGNSGLQLTTPDASTSTYSTYGTTSNSYGQDNMSLRGRVSTIPKGTILMVKLDHPISTASNKIGDPITGTVEADVYLDNQIAVPAGSSVEGSIVDLESAGRVSKPGKIMAQFSLLKTPTGVTIPLKAHVITEDNSGMLKGNSAQNQVLSTAGNALGVTAAGTLAGTALGGLMGAVGSGALFGVAAGGAAGIGYAVLKQGKQVTIPAGGRISIQLDQPAGIN